MRENPKPQEIYRHFKGSFYQIVTLAKHSESGETMVVYRALYGNCQVYVRELSEFMSETDKKKYPDYVQKYRFEKAARIGDAGQNGGQRMQDADREVIGMEESVSETEKTNQQKMRNVSVQAAEAEQEELNIDPLVMDFLDADSYEAKLNVLAALHHRITNEMIDTMAAASDIEIPAGDVEERYDALKNCMLTLEKYECNRLR